MPVVLIIELLANTRIKQNKTRALEEYQESDSLRKGDNDIALREKDEEIEVYKSGMEQALTELEELKLVCSTDSVVVVLHS